MQQQPQFGGGEVEAQTVLGDGESGAVEGESAVLFDGGPLAAGCLHPSQHGADTGFDDLGTGGFDDVVVGARLQSDDDVEVVTPGGEHDDRELAVLPDPAAHLDAVDPGQHQVQQEQIGLELREGGEPGLTGGGRTHLVAAAAQPEFDPFADGGVVFYEQHAWHLRIIPRVVTGVVGGAGRGVR